MKEHVAARFGITGLIQAFFQFCEVSKAVADLHCGTGIPYVPFDGAYATIPEPELLFDRDINSDALIAAKFPNSIWELFDKYPDVLAGLVAGLPGVASDSQSNLERVYRQRCEAHLEGTDT